MTIPDSQTQSSVLVAGDISKLSNDERVQYYMDVCHSMGLNPLTRPFEYLVLNGKTVLYARKDATEQLRKIHHISVSIVARELVEGCYIVTARASQPNGRVDEAIGAVSIEGLKGEARANALMKAETKAKRRVTLSIAGLGMFDESEGSSIPSAHVASVNEDAEELALADVQAKLQQARVSQAPPAPVAPAATVAPPSAPDALPLWPVTGKHGNKPMDQLDHSYLTWYCEKGSSVDAVKLALDELARRAAMVLL